MRKPRQLSTAESAKALKELKEFVAKFNEGNEETYAYIVDLPYGNFQLVIEKLTIPIPPIGGHE